MAEVGKTLLMTMVVRKNKEVKKCCGIEEGHISLDSKDDFVKK